MFTSGGGGGLCRPVFLQKGLQARPDVFLAVDGQGMEAVGLDAREGLQHGAFEDAAAGRLDLAVAEQVGQYPCPQERGNISQSTRC